MNLMQLEFSPVIDERVEPYGVENTGIYAMVTVKGVSGWGSKLYSHSAMGIWIASFPGNRWSKRIINSYSILSFCIHGLIESSKQSNEPCIIMISQMWKVNLRSIY